MKDRESAVEKAGGFEAVADEPCYNVPATSKTTEPPNDILNDSKADVPPSIRSFTDRALQFLSTASNKALAACIVGLGAGTYILLGRVGLVLIGVVGGVALHASWEGGSHGSPDESEKAQEGKRRRQLGVEVVSRILDWRAQRRKIDQSVEAEDDDDVRPHGAKTLSYADFRSATATALSNLTDAVIRDYVQWWYSPILPDDLSFPNACRQTLTAFVISVSTHFSRIRPADTFLDFLTNSSSILIVFLNELSSALRAFQTASVDEAIQTYLTYKPKSHLANIIDTRQQERKLRLVAEDVLESFVDSKTYNCEPAHVFLRQLLAKLILGKTIESCSKPEWINGWIVCLLEEGEPELMNAIDAGVTAPSERDLANIHQQSDNHVNGTNGLPKDAAETNNTSNMRRRRTVSRAEEAMEEAMQEAKRLTEMIAEEEARRLREQRPSEDYSSDGVSESMTQGIRTPTSSQSDLNADGEPENPRPLSESDSGCEGVLNEMARPKPVSTFTNFEQLVPSQAPTALLSTPERFRRDQASALTLYNAQIVIIDDSTPGEKGTIKAKPTADYLVQIEPASAQQPGWMIVRKYADFETLHEIMRRISVVSGIGFTEGHGVLPSWKAHTKASLRGELERYLNDAVGYRLLAESEGMKRFLEKDQGSGRSPAGAKGGFSGIGWPSPSAFENMGKGMMDVLTKAPKEVAGGGKALFGGVTGVLGGIGSSGLRKAPVGGGVIRPASNYSVPNSSRLDDNSMTYSASPRPSTESGRSSPVIDTQPARIPQMERRISRDSSIDLNSYPTRPSMSSRSSTYSRSRPESRPGSNSHTAESSPSRAVGELLNDFNLPPLPSDISDDYGVPSITSASKLRQSEDAPSSGRSSIDSASALRIPKEANATPTLQPTPTTSSNKPARQPKPKPPMTEQETQIAVELLFAVINELYTLSSAWNIRRTLLAAAKTFLLRPGNPQLENIRLLLQDTVIEANTSDAGIAAHLSKLRENALPTEEELKGWPPPMSEPDKAALRKKARKLLVERGMPQALTSVMGAAASGEALGKVFDCLQIQEVAQGLMFGLMLQAVRAVMQ